MKSAINEVRLRNVDAAAMAKLDLQAAEKNLSRNAYLKNIIEAAAFTSEIHDIESRYALLFNKLLEYMEQSTAEINRLSILVERLMGNE